MLSKMCRPSRTAATMVAQLSSSSTRLAASRATSVPPRPITTPMSACLSAGASLTPSPVIATNSPRDVVKAQIGRNQVAGLQQHDVAGHQMLGLHGGGNAVAAYVGLRCGQAFQGLHRAVGTPLLRQADRGVDMSSTITTIAIVSTTSPISPDSTAAASGTTIVNSAELVGHPLPGAARRRLGQAVRAMPLPTRYDVVCGQPERGIDEQSSGDLVGGASGAGRRPGRDRRQTLHSCGRLHLCSRHIDARHVSPEQDGGSASALNATPQAERRDQRALQRGSRGAAEGLAVAARHAAQARCALQPVAGDAA